MVERRRITSLQVKSVTNTEKPGIASKKRGVTAIARYTSLHMSAASHSSTGQILSSASHRFHHSYDLQVKSSLVCHRGYKRGNRTLELVPLQSIMKWYSHLNLKNQNRVSFALSFTWCAFVTHRECKTSQGLLTDSPDSFNHLRP